MEFASMVSAELSVHGHSSRSSGCYGGLLFKTTSSKEYISLVR